MAIFHREARRRSLEVFNIINQVFWTKSLLCCGSASSFEANFTSNPISHTDSNVSKLDIFFSPSQVQTIIKSLRNCKIPGLEYCPTSICILKHLSEKDITHLWKIFTIIPLLQTVEEIHNYCDPNPLTTLESQKLSTKQSSWKSRENSSHRQHHQSFPVRSRKEFSIIFSASPITFKSVTSTVSLDLFTAFD